MGVLQGDKSVLVTAVNSPLRFLLATTRLYGSSQTVLRSRNGKHVLSKAPILNTNTSCADRTSNSVDWLPPGANVSSLNLRFFFRIGTACFCGEGEEILLKGGEETELRRASSYHKMSAPNARWKYVVFDVPLEGGFFIPVVPRRYSPSGSSGTTQATPFRRNRSS
jgi:hypothetical protein